MLKVQDRRSVCSLPHSHRLCFSNLLWKVFIQFLPLESMDAPVPCRNHGLHLQVGVGGMQARMSSVEALSSETKQDTCESGVGHLLSECPWVLPPLLASSPKKGLLRSHERTHAPKTKFSGAIIDPYYYLQLWPQLSPDLPNIRVLFNL